MSPAVAALTSSSCQDTVSQRFFLNYSTLLSIKNPLQPFNGSMLSWLHGCAPTCIMREDTGIDRDGPECHLTHPTPSLYLLCAPDRVCKNSFSHLFFFLPISQHLIVFLGVRAHGFISAADKDVPLSSRRFPM